MKIYTKTGDDGTTGLIGGQRVAKHDARIECTGGVDELNAAIGWAAVVAEPGTLRPKLIEIQNEFFVLGSHLAVPGNAPPPSHLPPLEAASVARLEHEIDTAEHDLPPLRQFILPGGSEASARLHMARTVCRRAERHLTSFARQANVPPLMLRYLNRLSDWLFVQARWSNQRENVEDVPWDSGA